jgi:tetratricopeptide (TPR) repeat protein
MDLKDIASLENYLDSHSDSKLGILLADLYLQAGNLQEAVNRCREEITQNPHSALAYYLLAQIAIKLNRQEDALEYLKQTIALDSGFLEAYYQLVSVGQEILPPEAVKSCYLKIIELNPLDENAGQAAHDIVGKPDSGFLKAINLPALPEVTSVGEVPTTESSAEKDAEAVELEESEKIPPEPEVEKPQENEKEPVSELNSVEPEESVLLGEEEAHLGPPEPEEAESEPEIDIEQSEAAASPKLAPAPEPGSEQGDEIPETAASEAPHISSSTLKLSDMFNKMKSKPLTELQKEDWSFQAVNAAHAEKPRPEENGAGLPKSAEKTESAGDAKVEQLPEPATSPQKKAAAGAKKATPSMNEDKPEVTEESSKGAEQGRMELKIPVPTFTLVEVFKKQKLYDEALQLLDILEKRSKNQEKIAKVRQEIEELKLKDDLE